MEKLQNSSPSKQSRYRVRNEVREKECLACSGWFPATTEWFYFWGGSFTSRCRQCMKEIVYMQREDNPNSRYHKSHHD
ncbi:MAG: hypothetical protein K8H84_00155 [Sulfuricella denitrificans]|nr:hypothetical protein [Sulfuricella denitrificans]